MTSSPPIAIQEIRLFLIGLIFFTEESLLKYISLDFLPLSKWKLLFPIRLSFNIQQSDKIIEHRTDYHPKAVLCSGYYLFGAQRYTAETPERGPLG